MDNTGVIRGFIFMNLNDEFIEQTTLFAWLLELNLSALKVIVLLKILRNHHSRS